MMVYPRHYLLFVRGAVFLFSLCAATIQSAVLYWDISEEADIQSGNGIWSATDNNWSDGTDAPLFAWPDDNGNYARFGGPAGSFIISVDAVQNVDSLIFSTEGYSIRNGILASSNGMSIIVYDDLQSTIQSSLSITGSLHKDGGGTVVLSGTNSISDSIRIRTGILSVASDDALGDASIPVLVHNGGAVDINGYDLQNRNSISIEGRLDANNGALINLSNAAQYHAFRTIRLTGNAGIGNDGMRFDIGRGNDNNYSGIIGNGHVLTKIGNNEISLLARGTDIDSVAILGGIIIQERSDALAEAPIFIGNGAGLSSFHTITLNNRITVDSGTISSSLLPSHTSTYSNTITVSRHCFFKNDNSNTVQLSGTTMGPGTIEKTNKGKWVLIDSCKHTGGTIISGGVLQIGDNGTTGTLQGDIINNDTLIFNRSNAYAFSGNLSGSGVLVKEGDSTLTILSDNPFSGTTVINGGKLHIGRNGTTGFIGGSIVNNGVLRFNRSDTIEFDGEISGSGHFTKWGTGKLMLTADNSYTGGTFVETGTLQIGKGGTTGSMAGDIEIGNSLVFCRSDRYEYSGVISGTGTVSQTGTGTLRLTGEHTFTGKTSISQGTLELDGNFARNNSVYVENGATLSGTGTIGGTVFTDNNSIINPGNEHYGTLTAASARLSEQTQLQFDFDSTGKHDVFSLNGDNTHRLAGSILIRAVDGTLDTGSFKIITYSGTLENGSPQLTIGTVPQKYRAELVFRSGSVAVHIMHDDGGVPRVNSTTKTITLFVGDTVELSAHASGNNLRFAWFNAANPEDTLSTATTLRIGGVTIEDNKKSFYCTVSNANGTVTSDTYSFNVIQKVSVSSQPRPVSVTRGKQVQFYCTVAGTGPFSFTWYKDGEDRPVGTDSILTIRAAAFSDEGNYFCTVKNEFSSATSGNARLTILQPAPVARFSFSPTSGPVTQMITFTDKSEGNITAYEWDFGDENTSDEPNPEHFYEKSGRYSVTLTVSGPGGSSSITKTDSVFIYEPGQNPVRITARLITAGSVELTLHNISDIETLTPYLNGEKLGIWVKNGDTPKDTADGSLIADYSVSEFTENSFTDTVTLADTADTIYGFMCGLFWDDGNLSEFTPANGTLLLRVVQKNSISLDTLYIDTLSARLRVRWCIQDSSVINTSEVMITSSSEGFNETNREELHIPIDACCMETGLDFNEPLRYTTTYYISLWLHYHDSIWLEPTDSSRASIKIGTLSKQAVTFFGNDDITTPTGILNNSIVVWNAENIYDTPFTDTIEMINEPYAAKGFIVVGKPFLFKKQKFPAPVNIGVPIGAIPDGFSPANVRLYSDNNGDITVFHSTQYDEDRAIVHAENNNFDGIIVAMIDTLPPEIKVTNEIDAAISPGKDLTDNLVFSDNISNMKWTHYCAGGNLTPDPTREGMLTSPEEKVSVTIDKKSSALSSAYGLRSFIIVSDGNNQKTIDLSRCVTRKKSDEKTIPAGQWTPVYSTAVLNNTEPNKFIDRFPTVVDDNGYDPRQTRLYRWVHYSGNKSSDSKWVEYSRSNKNIYSLFTLDPGKIIWVKSRLKAKVHFDKGHTLSLKDTFTITIPVKQWMDIGNPYRFDISLANILAATGVEKSLIFYRWQKEKSSDTYTCKPLYAPGLTDYDNPNTVFSGNTDGGFSIYNTSSDAVTLRIPPVPYTESTAKKLSRKKKSSSWATVFSTRAGTNSDLHSVYCGYAPGTTEQTIPLSPTFAKVHPSIIDRTTGKQYGHFITNDNSRGFAKEILIKNGSGTTVHLSWNLTVKGAFPDNFNCTAFNPSESTTDSSGTITLSPHSSTSRWVLTGDASFLETFSSHIQSVEFGLKPVHSNPVRSTVVIRYTVPFGSREQLAVSVFNMLGKKVWSKELGSLLPAGTQTVVWNGTNRNGSVAGAGLYVVRLSVRNESRREIKRFHRHFTFVR